MEKNKIGLFGVHNEAMGIQKTADPQSHHSNRPALLYLARTDESARRAKRWTYPDRGGLLH